MCLNAFCTWMNEALWDAMFCKKSIPFIFESYFPPPPPLYFFPDVDECAVEDSPCGADQYCLNTDGSFSCKGFSSLLHTWTLPCTIFKFDLRQGKAKQFDWKENTCFKSMDRHFMYNFVRENWRALLYCQLHNYSVDLAVLFWHKKAHEHFPAGE